MEGGGVEWRKRGDKGGRFGIERDGERQGGDTEKEGKEMSMKVGAGDGIKVCLHCHFFLPSTPCCAGPCLLFVSQFSKWRECH